MANLTARRPSPKRSDGSPTPNAGVAGNRASSPRRPILVAAATALLAALAAVLLLGRNDANREERLTEVRLDGRTPVADGPEWADAPGRPAASPPSRLRVEVFKRYPHAPDAFTQGLLWHEGTLYESTGLEGRSSLRHVRLEDGFVLELLPLAPELFAEGLARVGDELIQLTWQNGRALVWDAKGFKALREHTYRGEGWGLCYDGKRLVMSDGSDTLTFRDPRSFEALGSVKVQVAGRPLRELNELECVGQKVYANVWRTNEIVQIDAANGRVEGIIDADGLLQGAERQGVDVLNGIAYIPERDRFLITGKLWPYLFEVRFVPAGASTSTP